MISRLTNEIKGSLNLNNQVYKVLKLLIYGKRQNYFEA